MRDGFRVICRAACTRQGTQARLHPPPCDLLCTFPRSASLAPPCCPFPLLHPVPPARHPRQNSCPFHCEPRAHPLCTHHQLLRCCIVRALYPLRSNPSQTEGRCKLDSPGDRTDFTVWGLGFGVWGFKTLEVRHAHNQALVLPVHTGSTHDTPYGAGDSCHPRRRACLVAVT